MKTAFFLLTALLAVRSSLASEQEAIDYLIREATEWGERCAHARADDPDALTYCSTRDGALTALAQNGWCYSQSDHDKKNGGWARCDGDKKKQKEKSSTK